MRQPLRDSGRDGHGECLIEEGTWAVATTRTSGQPKSSENGVNVLLTALSWKSRNLAHYCGQRIIATRTMIRASRINQA